MVGRMTNYPSTDVKPLLSVDLLNSVQSSVVRLQTVRKICIEKTVFFDLLTALVPNRVQNAH